jgi:hypothetical protein
MYFSSWSDVNTESISYTWSNSKTLPIGDRTAPVITSSIHDGDTGITPNTSITLTGDDTDINHTGMNWDNTSGYVTMVDSDNNPISLTKTTNGNTATWAIANTNNQKYNTPYTVTYKIYDKSDNFTEGSFSYTTMQMPTPTVTINAIDPGKNRGPQWGVTINIDQPASSIVGGTGWNLLGRMRMKISKLSMVLGMACSTSTM